MSYTNQKTAARPLKPFTMSGKLLRVPAFPNMTARCESTCTGCVLHYDERMGTRYCHVSRCRYIHGEDKEAPNAKMDDFLLINPAKLEKYQAAYAAYILTDEAEEDGPGKPWDFR